MLSFLTFILRKDFIISILKAFYLLLHSLSHFSFYLGLFLLSFVWLHWRGWSVFSYSFNESSPTHILGFSFNQSYCPLLSIIIFIQLSLDLLCCSSAKLSKQRSNSFIFILPCLTINQFIALHFFSLSVALASAQKTWTKHCFVLLLVFSK